MTSNTKFNCCSEVGCFCETSYDNLNLEDDFEEEFIQNKD